MEIERYCYQKRTLYLQQVFGNKASFVSLEWFPDFANIRRNGYVFCPFENLTARYEGRKKFEVE